MSKVISKIKCWFNDKSYRKKFRYYYLLTFIIPIIVIMLFNVITQHVVKNQVIVSNEKILNQFFNVLDERFNGVMADVQSIVSEDLLWTYAQLSADGSVKSDSIRLSIKTMLNEYKKEKNVYEDVLVWFASDDYVISGTTNKAGGTQGIRNYAKVSYTKDEAFLTEFEEIVKCESLLPHFRTIGEGTEKQYLCVSVKQRLTRNEKKNYTVTLVMDSAFLNSSNGQTILEKGESMIFFDEEGIPLFSYNKPVLDILPEEYRNSGNYDIEINGQEYTILVKKSDVMKGYYVMEVSHAVFFRSLSVIRMISFGGIFASILVGIFVSRKMNQNTYSPIEMAVAVYQDEAETKFDASKHNEFDFMIESLRKKSEEKERIRRQKQEDDKVLQKKELLLAVLEGKEMYDSEIEKLERQIISSHKFFGGVLQLKHCGKAGWDMITFIVNNVFKEILGERYQCDILSVSSTRHIFILGIEREEQEEELVGLLREGVEFLNQRVGAEAVFGAGNVCNGLYGLRSMYREAQKALEYRFLLKGESVIRYRDIQGRYIGNSSGEETQLFHMVNGFLKSATTKENTPKAFVRHLVNVYGINVSASIDDVENFRREIANALNRIWMNTDLEYFQRDTYMTQLAEADHLDDYLEALANILCETRKDSQDNESRIYLVQQIERYVEENYASSDLNVNSVGKEIGLQAAYLSKIFREEKGVLLINYISFVRISHAKELLRETRMTLEEIAQKTGFLSVNVFINNFKKMTGVTPGKYRASARSVNIEEISEKNTKNDEDY